MRLSMATLAVACLVLASCLAPTRADAAPLTYTFSFDLLAPKGGDPFGLAGSAMEFALTWDAALAPITFNGPSGSTAHVTGYAPTATGQATITGSSPSSGIYAYSQPASNFVWAFEHDALGEGVDALDIVNALVFSNGSTQLRFSGNVLLHFPLSFFALDGGTITPVPFANSDVLFLGDPGLTVTNADGTRAQYGIENMRAQATAAPEPSSLLMLGAGLVVALRARRRGRQR